MTSASPKSSIFSEDYGSDRSERKVLDLLVVKSIEPIEPLLRAQPQQTVGTFRNRKNRDRRVGVHYVAMLGRHDGHRGKQYCEYQFG